MDKTQEAFDEWMGQVDQYAVEIAGVSIHDLADIAYRDIYEDGIAARDAAMRALTYDGWVGQADGR